MISKILTESALTIVMQGLKKPFVISKDHKLFLEILEAVNLKDEEKLLGLIDLASQVDKISKGKVQILNGQVYVNNELVHNLVAQRILELHAMKYDFSFMAKFLENLMLNPSYQSRQELYLFLENGNMPITDDGRFLAYKWVRDDYYDCHTGSFSLNVPGAVVSMERRAVNDDRQETCSDGLHVCTQGYTKFGKRLMVVAVNPKDVVSVPYDYNNAKMRVCEYEVLYEIETEDYKGFDTPIMSGSSKGTPQRDSRGRFVKAA